MAAPPEMRGYPRGANDGGGGENLLLAWMGDRRRRRRRGGGVPRQLRDSSRALMMLGALVLTWRRVARCNPEHVLAGFALWLLGAGLAMLSLVAGQFPRLAATGAGLARALRCYLLGGL
ncbi:hypothetical protein SETIT_5G126600v2 [Setaria italica]|uniref:Uncharacterized protein n=2 Tax=Setaria TaxID=4554 RepID=A0A368R418_SETIT|nr:hypothetical protein SETIT_5G126600v2 [Setaria italica]TKW13787.1 hypothetical protein SEVIR_5G123700v2 [Setaria viridis]